MDYLRFSEMMRRGGDLDGVRILSPKTVDYMAMDHLPGALTATGVGENPTSTLMGSGFGFGLGFGVLTDAVATGRLEFSRRVQLGRRSGNAVLDRPGGGGDHHRHDPVDGVSMAAALRDEGADVPGR